LTALEDLLDSWPGTLIVVSHDRYFVERVTDNVYGLMGDGGLRHLPGGIDQYVKERRAAGSEGEADWAPKGGGAKPLTPGAQMKADRKEVKRVQKELRRIERQLESLNSREAELHELLIEHATDYEQLAPLQAELATAVERKESLEAEWLENSELLEAG
ncbi:MAG: ABC transporter ATP-binding protein, partial [Solirubrobacterales bacterium]